MEDKEIEKLIEKARQIRIAAIDAIAKSGDGHIGGSMSMVETLTLLYYKYMKVDPKDPAKPDRDRLVLSKTAAHDFHPWLLDCAWRDDRCLRASSPDL